MRRAAALVSVAGIAAFASADGIDVGQLAGGRLGAAVEVEQPFPMSVSLFPGIDGYATGLVGFASVVGHHQRHGDLDEPDPNSDIRFVLVAADPDATVWYNAVPVEVGGMRTLGPPEFDFHPIWSIDVGAPWQARTFTFVLHDANGIHADSDPFTVSFVTAPPNCPGDANGNGTVSFSDITSVLANYGAAYGGTIGGPGDADRSGVVEFADITSVLANYNIVCGL
jgi:hypothetical protein